MKTPLLTWRRFVLAAVVFVVAWYAGSYPRGMAMAYIDHARGNYEIKGWGLPAPWWREETKLLRERYGVVEEGVGGCMLFPTTKMYATGYNSVSGSLLVKKFDKDIFEECRREALRRWEAENRRGRQERP
ncbi:MAG TPA: hypothetical protein VFW33_05650 [Gemmataceae bacterium]|nr:hypothetical protein [Gemmataceae bacterium]